MTIKHPYLRPWPFPTANSPHLTVSHGNNARKQFQITIKTRIRELFIGNNPRRRLMILWKSLQVVCLNWDLGCVWINSPCMSRKDISRWQTFFSSTKRVTKSLLAIQKGECEENPYRYGFDFHCASPHKYSPLSQFSMDN